MKTILFDIGHPAHVHYFRNMINVLKERGNQVLIIAREKEITFLLLEAYNFNYKSRGQGRNTLIGKFFYLFLGAFRVWKYAYRMKIDLYVSFASPYNALASIFYNKPNITFDDTEHNIFNHRIYTSLSSSILTPIDFKKDFGNNHIRFNATMDVAYLHPKYYIYRNVEFRNHDTNKKIVILRIVSWKASHDLNQSGFKIEEIFSFIEVLKKFADIYISSESTLPKELNEYLINIDPEDMHNYMHNADLFIGESGSMATESVFLGTHSIVLNSASSNFGVFDRLSKYKTFMIAKDFEDLLNTATNLIKQDNLSYEGKKTSSTIIDNCINLTDLMVWFVENYPESHTILKENSDYQNRFE